jgi:hypothetical protein
VAGGGSGGGDVMVVSDDDRFKVLPINTPTPMRAIPNAPEPSHDFVLRLTSFVAPSYTLPLLFSSGLVSFIIILFLLPVEALLLQMIP